MLAQFSQKKVDSQIRWSVVNVVTLLRRHSQVHSELANLMGEGASVGKCISFLEQRLANVEFI